MNAFTVDLEEWFCCHNLRNSIPYKDWDAMPSRIEYATGVLLDLLQKNNTKATFFVLGWIAERFPALVQAIAREGHEIATHGYSHTLLTELSPKAFEQDLRESMTAIYNACQVWPKGYRAPAFSLVSQTVWALPILESNGLVYDSSIYPVNIHRQPAMANAPLDICQIGSDFVEFPLSCAEYLGLRLPCSSGAYLRFFPYPVFKRLVQQVIRAQRSFIFQIHPWELDPEMARIKRPFTSNFWHFANIGSAQQKVERLLHDFSFTTLQQILAKVNGGLAASKPQPYASAGKAYTGKAVPY